MTVLAKAEPLPDDEMPPRAPRGAPLGKEGALIADLLKLLLKIRAREIDVAARLLARSDELEMLAAGVRKNLAMLQGWRFDIFGHEALNLVEGKMAFAVEHGKLKMTRIEGVSGDGPEIEADHEEAGFDAEFDSDDEVEVDAEATPDD
jgi:ribonuclease D